MFIFSHSTRPFRIIIYPVLALEAGFLLFYSIERNVQRRPSSEKIRNADAEENQRFVIDDEAVEDE